MDIPPRKPKGGVKNKTGIINVNYLQNVGKSSEWFVLNITKYNNRYVKSFDNFNEAYNARNGIYYMYNLPLPWDDWDKLKKFEKRFLKNNNIKYGSSRFQ